MQKIKNILIVSKPRSNESFKLAKEIADWLNKKKICTYSINSQNTQKIESYKLKKTHLAIVVGGDGTYLQANQLLEGFNIPILGVNLGSLGFLTTIPAQTVLSELEIILEKELETRPRSMLEVKCSTKKSKIKYNALNDVIIERGDSTQLISISIYRNTQFVYELKADGLIISTPTGSTAYNLAAGGPIVYPYADVNIVTPIAPHSLTSRPIIFPAKDILSFKILKKQTKKIRLTIDGQFILKLGNKDEVTIKKAEEHHLVLRKLNHNYFDILRKKLQFGQRN